MSINDLISSIKATDKYEPNFQLNYNNALKSAGILKEAADGNTMSGIGDWIKNNPNIMTALLGGAGGLAGGAMGGGKGGILGALLMGALGHYAPKLFGYGETGNLASGEDWGLGEGSTGGGILETIKGWFGGGKEAPTDAGGLGDITMTDKPLQEDPTGVGGNVEPPVEKSPASTDLDQKMENKIPTAASDYLSNILNLLNKKAEESLDGAGANALGQAGMPGPNPVKYKKGDKKKKKKPADASKKDETSETKEADFNRLASLVEDMQKDKKNKKDKKDEDGEDGEDGEEKNKPKRDGTGKGTRANKGRGGCDDTNDIGKMADFDRLAGLINDMQKDAARSSENAQNAFGQRGLPPHGNIVSEKSDPIDDINIAKKPVKKIVDPKIPEDKVTKTSSSFLGGFYKGINGE